MPPLSNIIEAPLRLLGEYKVKCMIVGGVAAAIHGSLLLTNDLDVCYSRDSSNLQQLAAALQSVNARLRNAPEGLPFILDSETRKRGLKFTFTTDIGDLDLLGEMRGVGPYEDVLANSVAVELFGYNFAVIDYREANCCEESCRTSKGPNCPAGTRGHSGSPEIGRQERRVVCARAASPPRAPVLF